MKEVELILIGFDTGNNNYILLPEPIKITMDYSDLPIELKDTIDEDRT